MVIETSHHTEHPGAITLPITSEHEQMAQRFVAQCPLPEKAQQIEHNTLAVCAVNTYLQMMGIDTDIAASDSWNPMMQMMADTADLKLPTAGSLSCRAMTPEDDACYVPPEDWSDRAGYIAVVIDKAEHQATLLGFAQTVGEEERIAIARFSPIETLLDHLYTLKTETQTTPITPLAIASITDSLQTTLTRMSQWAQGTLDNGWQAVDELLNPPQAGFAFRSTSTANSATNTPSIRQAKAIQLEDSSSAQPLQVALIIQLSQVSADATDIIMQVHPLGRENHLPEGIALSIFDDNNTPVRSATSRAIDNYIQLQVVGEPGELFSIQIRKNNATFEEQFEI